MPPGSFAWKLGSGAGVVEAVGIGVLVGEEVSVAGRGVGVEVGVEVGNLTDTDGDTAAVAGSLVEKPGDPSAFGVGAAQDDRTNPFARKSKIKNIYR